MENQTFSGAPTGPNPQAMEQVKLPAIFLIIVGGLNVAYALYSFAQSLFGPDPAEDPRFAELMNRPDLPSWFGQYLEASQTIGVVVALLWLVMGAVITWGGLKMKSLENRGLSMAAAILAMIPCTSPMSCCCIGIGVGIWALVVLGKPEVKTAFRS